MELVWEGKYTSGGARRVVCFETAESNTTFTHNYSSEPSSTNQLKSKVYLGDNFEVMSSLLAQYRASFDLIYLDPPFEVGSNFKIERKVSSTNLEPEKVSIPVYSDTWGEKENSFQQMLYERLLLVRELLKQSGALFLHCDYRTTASTRLMLEEVFGKESYVNEIIWHYKTGGMPEKVGFARKHDTIHYIVKDKNHSKWFGQKEKSYLTHKYGFSNVKIYNDDQGDYTLVNCRDVFDIPALRGNSPERIPYPTQKPEKLLERLILSCTEEGDLVGDFFCGSGTTGLAAGRLGRSFILADSSGYAVDTAGGRLSALKNFDFSVSTQKSGRIKTDALEVKVERQTSGLLLHLKSVKNDKSLFQGKNKSLRRIRELLAEDSTCLLNSWTICKPCSVGGEFDVVWSERRDLESGELATSSSELSIETDIVRIIACDFFGNYFVQDTVLRGKI